MKVVDPLAKMGNMYFSFNIRMPALERGES